MAAELWVVSLFLCGGWVAVTSCVVDGLQSLPVLNVSDHSCGGSGCLVQPPPAHAVDDSPQLIICCVGWDDHLSGFLVL